MNEKKDESLGAPAPKDTEAGASTGETGTVMPSDPEPEEVDLTLKTGAIGTVGSSEDDG